MRLPLKVQIVAPLAALTLATIAALVAYQARIAADEAAERIERQIDGVTQTLAGSTFPLTPRVLGQMHDLSGAEFVVETPAREGPATIEVSPAGRQALAALETRPQAPDGSVPRLTSRPRRQVVTLAGVNYFHAEVTRSEFGRHDRVHLLYPEADYRRALAAAAWPPVTLGLASLAAVIAAGWWIAARVARGVTTVGEQVDRIAGGDFRADDAPPRNDELGDLQRGVNRMAMQLAEYETEVRRTEQLRTLGQLGAGLAHEIRNAATGARLALQHHQQMCPADDAQLESISVASRQLEHIEEYVQRFVRVGCHDSGEHRTTTDVNATAGDAYELAEPYAQHLGVRLTLQPAAMPATLHADDLGVRQAIYNLLVNAIDAAAGGPAPAVELRIDANDDEARIFVTDSGPGPAADLAPRMFDAFATDKPDGAGLGLALVERVAAEHNGRVQWRREDERTEFVITLPRGEPALPLGEAL